EAGMNRTVRVAAVVLATGALLSACGGGKKSETKGGATTIADAATLSGAGSTFVNTILQQWVKDYQKVASRVTVNYQAVGSGAGIQQLTAKTVDFGGSDVPLKPEEQQATGGPGSVVQVPWIAGGIAVEYNVPEVKDLKLS